MGSRFLARRGAVLRGEEAYGEEGEMAMLPGDTLGARTAFDGVTWDVGGVEYLLVDNKHAQVWGFACLAFFFFSSSDHI